MTDEDRIEMLEEAEAALDKAIRYIRDAVYGTDEENRAEHYILPHLESWVDDSTGCSYNSIADIKKAFEGEVPEDPNPNHDWKPPSYETERKDQQNG